MKVLGIVPSTEYALNEQHCLWASALTWELGNQPAAKSVRPLFLGMVLLEHSHVHVFLYCLWLLLRCNGRAEKVPPGPYGTQSPTCLPWGPSQKKFTNLWCSTIKIYWTPVVYQIMKSLFCGKIAASNKYLNNPCDSPYMHVPTAPHLSNGCIIAPTPECLQRGQCLEHIKCPINISHNYYLYRCFHWNFIPMRVLPLLLNKCRNCEHSGPSVLLI